MSFSLTAIDWVPPSETAGHLDALAELLRARADEPLTVRVGPELGAGWDARVEDIVETMTGHELQGTASSAATPLRAVVRGLGGAAQPLPLARIPGPVTQRPRYRSDVLELDAAAARAAAGASGRLLLVDVAAVELAGWNALETRSVGSCDAALEALAGGQERSLALAAPFLDHVDASLWQVFRGQLAAYVPELQKDLSTYGAVDGSATPRARCGAAYREHVEAYAACLGTPGAPEPQRCAYAPRAFLAQSGLQLGMVEPLGSIADACPEVFGRDVREELRRMGRESAKVVTARLDPVWTELVDRLGAVSEVHGAVSEICVPRRRRFSEADLDTLHGRLARIGETLSRPPDATIASAWRVGGGSFPVPGLGDVYQVASVARGPNALADQVLSQARGMREFAFARAVCRTRRESVPLAVALVDARASELQFFGYLYPEELHCEGLGPLLRRAELSR
ncbi:MAG: hypothetical protein H6713_04955 [Myxococcales bacterium]|nr:hypothetical protein [Myxococcales bacterium]